MTMTRSLFIISSFTNLRGSSLGNIWNKVLRSGGCKSAALLQVNASFDIYARGWASFNAQLRGEFEQTGHKKNLIEVTIHQ